MASLLPVDKENDFLPYPEKTGVKIFYLLFRLVQHRKMSSWSWNKPDLV